MLAEVRTKQTSRLYIMWRVCLEFGYEQTYTFGGHVNARSEQWLMCTTCLQSPQMNAKV